MNEKELKQITEAVEKAVQEKVNGKIDKHIREQRERDRENRKMIEEFNGHMKDVKPFLDGWRGAMILGKAIKYMAGVLAAAGALYIILTQGFK